MIKVGEVVGDALLYVREATGRVAPPSGVARTKLWSAAHIWPEKSNFKFGIHLYLCRNFIVFVLKLVYLYMKLPLRGQL